MRDLRVQLRFDPEHPIEVGTLAEDGRDDLRRLAEDAGLRPQDARRILDEVVAATEGVEAHLAAHRCGNPVSRAAATAVLAATRRLQG